LHKRDTKILRLGQKVQIGEDKGTITAVDLLHIILANENNESIVIPTKNLSDQTIRVFGDPVKDAETAKDWQTIQHTKQKIHKKYYFSYFPKNNFQYLISVNEMLQEIIWPDFIAVLWADLPNAQVV